MGYKDPEKQKEYLKQYTIKNRDRRLEYNRKNKEKQDAVHYAYVAKHKDRINLQNKRKANKRKQTIVNLLGNKCSLCGKEYPVFVYDLHHRDPSEKEFHPGSLYARNWDTILKEVSKCDLVCANCHRILHHGNKYDLLKEDFEEEEDDESTEGE